MTYMMYIIYNISYMFAKTVKNFGVNVHEGH